MFLHEHRVTNISTVGKHLNMLTSTSLTTVSFCSVPNKSYPKVFYSFCRISSDICGARPPRFIPWHLAVSQKVTPTKSPPPLSVRPRHGALSRFAQIPRTSLGALRHPATVTPHTVSRLVPAAAVLILGRMLIYLVPIREQRALLAYLALPLCPSPASSF